MVLVDDLTAPLAALTAAHIGEERVILVCGEAVMRPVLREALTTAKFALSVSDGDEAHHVEGLLKAKTCP